MKHDIPTADRVQAVTRAKRPRRRLPPARKAFQFRFSQAEIDELDARADAAGLDRSKFLRHAIFHTAVVSPHEARRQTFILKNVANNMNQIAKWANTFQADADALAVIQQLRQIDLHLRQAFDLGDAPLLKPEYKERVS